MAAAQPPVSYLVLATYASTNVTQRALGLLRARGELDSAATVRADAEGAYTLTLTDRHASGEAFWGVFWEAFFGLVFHVPVPGTAYGSNLGGSLALSTALASTRSSALMCAASCATEARAWP